MKSGVWLFLGVFWLVGLSLLGFALWNTWRSTRAASWPTAPGTILDLSLDTKPGEDQPTYEIKVKYAYSVDGIAYEGNRLAFGYASSSGYDAHQQIHRKLTGSREVLVRYDPSDPSVSCLSFGLHRSLQFLFAFAILWLGFIAGFTALYWIGLQQDSVLLENLQSR